MLITEKQKDTLNELILQINALTKVQTERFNLGKRFQYGSKDNVYLAAAQVSTALSDLDNQYFSEAEANCLIKIAKNTLDLIQGGREFHPIDAHAIFGGIYGDWLALKGELNKRAPLPTFTSVARENSRDAVNGFIDISLQLIWLVPEVLAAFASLLTLSNSPSETIDKLHDKSLQRLQLAGPLTPFLNLEKGVAQLGRNVSAEYYDRQNQNRPKLTSSSDSVSEKKVQASVKTTSIATAITVEDKKNIVTPSSGSKL